MADLTITATSVVAGTNAKTRTRILGVAATAGQSMYKDSADLEKAKLSDCDGVAAARVFDGIALNGGAAGQPVTLVYEGDVTIGAALTKGQAYYMSPTPGGICPLADVLTGDLPVFLGIAISTTVLRLRPITAELCPVMEVSRLDRLISIERVATAVNEYNEQTGQRVEFATVYANVQPVSDGERMRAGETLAERKSRFTIHYSSEVATVDARDFILYDGRLYDINGVKEIGRRKYLEITATARAETP